MADNLIRQEEAKTILLDRANSYKVSMFATSSECNVARTVAFECAALIGGMLPTGIDSVVRCKECRHWGSGWYAETEFVKECKFAHYMVGCNGFCVYGEKRHAE